jgi:hypothetical protein
MTKLFLLTAATLACNILHAQNTLPNTDIFLLDMKQQNGQYSFGQPVNITNREGYDNQPYFTPDGKYVYYSSIRENKNADIYRYEIGSGQTEQFTNTPTDEYSPQLSPDGKYISVVRVEKDSEQRIWLLPVKKEKGKEKEYVIMQNMDSVGYYTWINKTNIAFIDIRKPQWICINSGKIERFFDTRPAEAHKINSDKSINCFDKGVGRALLKSNSNSNYIKGEHVLYTKLENDSSYSVYSYPEEGYAHYRNKKVISLPKGTQDFALGPDNTIYTGSKGKLYKFKQGTDKDWVQIADFSNTTVKDFYRLAINKKGDRIALVSFTGAKP